MTEYQTIKSTTDVTDLSEGQRKELAKSALGNLGPEAQQEVMRQVRIAAPGQLASDRIWTIIVSSFSVVLVGAFLSLAATAIGVAAKGGSGDTMLTVFTTAAGFLAGRLSPSPLTGSSGRT